MLQRRGFLIALFLFSSTLFGQTPAPSSGVPTTKVLAVGSTSSPLTPEQRKNLLPREVHDAVALYLSGKIDQWYWRQDGKGVVFLMNVSTVEEAQSLLDKLPLGESKLMSFELIPLGPLSPLRVLLNSTSPTPAK
jgi:hypothetical protein